MSKAAKKLYWIFGIYFFCVVAFIITPVFMPIWNHAEPFIMGWPLSQVCVFGAGVLLIIGMNVAFRIEGKINEEEERKREAGEEIDY